MFTPISTNTGNFYHAHENFDKLSILLNSWQNNITVKGNKQEAVTRIKEAFAKKNTELDLSSLGLTSIPECLDQLLQLQKLDLSCNPLTSMPAGIRHLVNLRVLELYDSQLTSLPPEIGNLHQLEELDLAFNHLTDLPPEIGKLQRLQKLSLSANQLTGLPPEIGNLQQLHVLYLSVNSLTDLPPELRNLIHLKEFSVSYNPSLEKLPLNSAVFSNLAHIDIEKTSISMSEVHFLASLKDWINNSSVAGNKTEAAKRIMQAFLTKCTELDLRKLKINSLPVCLGQLSELRELDLESNELDHFPLVIGNLLHLETLNMNFNKLTSLPPEIGNLHKLKSFYIEKNQLVNLPPEIGKLQELQSIILYGNRLISLPPEIGNLQQLQYLSAPKNFLTSLPCEIGNLLQLKVLYLYKNLLMNLPREIGNLQQLAELALNENQLTSIPSEMGSLLQLVELSLDDNQLTSLPIELGNLLNLEQLTVPGNGSLAELPLSLSQIAQLTSIEIEGTQIPDAMRDAILTSCRSVRDELGLLVLADRIRSWLVASKVPQNEKEFEHFLSETKTNILDANQKLSINEWLFRLEKTKDFRGAQTNLAQVVCGILKTVISDQEFKQLFISQIEANNEGCGDRSSMSLNVIFTAWKIRTLPSTGSFQEKIDIMVRGAKTLCLRRMLGQMIDQRQAQTGLLERESVEIYLYYETLLKTEHNLLSAVEKMLYSDVGKRDWIDTGDLIQKMNNNYLDDFINLPIFKELIDQNPDFVKHRQQIYSKYEKELDKLSEPSNPEDKEISKLVKYNELMLNRESEWSALAKQIAEEWINSSSTKRKIELVPDHTSNKRQKKS